MIRGTPIQIDTLLERVAVISTVLVVLFAGTAVATSWAAIHLARQPKPAPDVIVLNGKVPIGMLRPFPGTVTPDYETVGHIAEYITRVFGVDSNDLKQREILNEIRDRSTEQAYAKLGAWYHADKDANNPWALHWKYSQDVEIQSILPLPNVPNAYEAHFITRRYANNDYQAVGTQEYWMTLVSKTGAPQRTNLDGWYADALAFAKEGQ